MESMNDLLKDFDVKRIKAGDILKGKVIDVNDKQVSVNINYAFDGVIYRNELTVNDVSPLDIVKPGDEIDVYVISPNDGEGYVELSRIQALAITEKEDLKKAFENGNTIRVFVKEEVKGGLVAYYGSIRVFIPASLASRERIELKTLLGKEIEVKLTELDLRNRKVVASRRVLEEAAYEIEKKSLWSQVKAGEKKEGIVKKIINAGAIVDIGGITGLVHITQLSWERVKRVEDVVNVGDKVTVVIAEVDPKKERVSLILKDVDKEPWKVHGDSIKVGQLIEGTVSKLLGFGAFVEILPGIEGLVHINEISEDHIAKPGDVLQIGQKVKVKVLDVNKADRKISLTIKDAAEKSKEYLKYNDGDDEVTLGDLFKGLF